MNNFIERLKKLNKEQSEIFNEMENQPSSGWEDVDPDTLVLVRSRLDADWETQYFAKYEDGKLFCYTEGRTSKTTRNRGVWKYAMLLEEEEDNDVW